MRSLVELVWERLCTVPKEEFPEYFDYICNIILEKSPSLAFQSCQALALEYPPLNKDLVQPAVLSIARSLSESQRSSICSIVEKSLETASLEALQVVLSFVECMKANHNKN